MRTRNDDGTFVSWADVLRPEDAAVRQNREETNSRWGVVWAEATVLESLRIDPQAPNAVVVTFDGVEEAEEAEVQSRPKSTESNDDNAAGPSVSAATDDPTDLDSNVSTAVQDQSDNIPWKHGNFVDMLVGASLVLSAVMSTVAIGLAAAILYHFAVAFHKVARDVFGPCKIYGILFYALCEIITYTFLFTDFVMLLVSVLVAEIMAGLAFLLCSLFGGFCQGYRWHQYIRRLCHLMRWALQGYHEGWEPSRHHFRRIWARQRQEQFKPGDDMDIV